MLEQQNCYESSIDDHLKWQHQINTVCKFDLSYVAKVKNLTSLDFYQRECCRIFTGRQLFHQSPIALQSGGQVVMGDKK